MALAEQVESEAPSPDQLLAPSSSVSPLRTVAKGALALVSTQPLTWAASLVATLIVPRVLGDVVLGQFTLALAFSSILGPVVTLGLMEYLSRRIAQRAEDAARLATASLVLMTLVGILVAAVLGLALPLTGLDIGGPLVLVAAMGLIVITPAQGVLLTVLRGQERMGRFAAVNSITAAANVLIPCVVLLAGGGVGEFAITGLLVSLVSLCISWLSSDVHLPRVRISAPVLLSLLPLGFPFLAWTVTQNFYNFIDRVMLGAMAPVEVVGWYAAANRIIAIPVFVPMLFVTPLFPALTRCRGDRDVFSRTLNTSLRATLLVTTPFCAAIVAAAPAVPRFLGWPDAFKDAILPMAILAPNISVIAVDMILGTALLALGFERKWLVVGLVAAAVNVGLNLLAIPFTQAMWGNGGIGASGVTIATEVVMLVGALVLMPKGIVDGSFFFLVVRVFLTGVVFVVVARYLLGTNWWLPIALIPGGLAWLVSSVALRLVRVSDIREADQFVRGMLHRRRYET